MIGKLLFAVIATAPVAYLATALGRKPVVIPTSLGDSTGITVSGEGEVEAPPDTATFSVGVSVQARTVAEARAGAATAAAAILASVRANGIASEDIQTVNLSIQPVYEYRNNQEPRVTGYSVSNTVSVKVRNLDILSKVVDDAAEAGGDATRLDSIAFAIADSTALIAQAREAAVQDARRKAEQLARAAGVTLGAAQSISELSSFPVVPIRKEAALMRAAADASTPIETGTSKVRVSVTVRYAILPAA